MPVFFFSDIEGSTRKWEQYKEGMSKALIIHDEIIKRNIEINGGMVIKHTGDGFFACFEQGKPIKCAIDIQKEIASIDWGEIGELRVRIALNAGYAEKRKDDYFGPVINRTARILSAAWGGQILLTPEVLNVCELPSDAKLKDLGRHMLKDLGEPQLIYCLLSPDLPLQEFPPIRSLSAYIHNLPVQTTPFLGREKELLEIEHLLQIPECRLLTIIGPGGIGKSRLALQAAADMIEIFTQGVFLISLAPLNSVQFLISAIADQIKFSFYSRHDPKEQLLNYLSEKKLLLILDNFEHIIEGASIITEILKNAPQVKIIVTSREMLNLQGEWLHQVQGLEFPAGEKVDIGDFSAVQLFLHSARRIKTDFTPSGKEMGYIVRICQLVSGIPLGIELASSWLRILSLDEITKEIEKNLDFLTSRMRDLPERHHSMRAVFEYSWNLLSAGEKELLARLSVFPRKFSRAAAEKIAGATLPLLTSLIDKSLLLRDSSGYYEIIGVLRQYAGEKLRTMQEVEQQTINLFYEFYADFVDSIKDGLYSAQNVSIVNEVKNELDNIRTAWSGIVEKGDEKLIEKSLMGIFLIYDSNGWFKEGAESLQRIIDRLGKKEKRGKHSKIIEIPLIGKIYNKQAKFLCQLGFYEDAIKLLNRSFEIARKYKNKEDISAYFNALGNVLYMRSQFEEARKVYNNWLETAKELNHEKEIAGAYNNLGVISYVLGEFDKAKELFETSKIIAEKIGYKKGIAFANTNIALVLHATGNHQEAKKIFLEELNFDQEFGDKINIANTLNNLGLVYKALNEIDDAKEVFEQSLKIRQEIGDRMGITISLNNLGDIAYIQKRYEDAITLFSEWKRISQSLNDASGEMKSYMNMGRVFIAEKDYESAKKHLFKAMQMILQNNYMEDLNDIMYLFADLLSATGNETLALKLICFVIAHETKDKNLLNLANELLNKLTGVLPAAEIAAAREEVKSATAEKYIQEIATLFKEKITFRTAKRKKK